MSRKILFATVQAGGGHIATAIAMAQSIETKYPDHFNILVLDFMKEVGCTKFDRMHKGLWRFALRYPFFVRLGQIIIDLVPGINIKLQRQILNNFARKAYSYISQNPVDLIVSNHPFVTTGLALAKKTFGLQVPVLTFANEPYMISALWADPDADYILTPTLDSTNRLSRMGVCKNKLETIGWPVKQAFFKKKSKINIRRQLDLDHRFTSVFLLGGEGIATVSKPLIVSLATSSNPIQLVVICGRNKSLFYALKSMQIPHLKVLGFVENLADYIFAADVVVGKSGPACVYESLVVGRPFLITGYAGLNELGVLRFLQHHSLGFYVKNIADLRREVSRLQSNPTIVTEIFDKCQHLKIKNQTDLLAHRIVQYLNQQNPTDL